MTPVMALLLATLGLTGVLTYQAADAAASHRRTAERALRDHATFAAWVYTRLIREEITWSLFSALKPLAQNTPVNAEALPTAEQLDKSIRALIACDCPAAKLVHAYFAIDLKHGPTIWRGKKPDPRTQVWVSDTVRAHAPARYGARWDFALILGTASTTPPIAYILRRNGTWEPRVAVGAVLDTALFSQALDWPYQRHEPLPSALTRETSNASVLHLAVTLASGDVLYSGGNPYPETVTASDTLGVQQAHTHRSHYWLPVAALKGLGIRPGSAP